MSSHLRTMFSSAGSPFSSQPSSRAHSPDPSHHHHAPSDLGETDHHDSQRDILDADVPFELIPEGSRRKRIVVAITGATGTTIAIRLLQALKALDIETHLVMSKWAVNTLKYETDHTASEVS
ncbi:hypothetical protein QFC22_001234 [Naganishia vaughanmartiniae]|uniref:Uncharacterized protein n=1 Tax=Naganishia vaughanmartiniae TaxID=1424756 RepID=A0ACC2XI23_9TREE|nr:hypothetical protein QFC22_001234 [Naganishia vaughanmartiniae]